MPESNAPFTQVVIDDIYAHLAGIVAADFPELAAVVMIGAAGAFWHFKKDLFGPEDKVEEIDVVKIDRPKPGGETAVKDPIKDPVKDPGMKTDPVAKDPETNTDPVAKDPETNTDPVAKDPEMKGFRIVHSQGSRYKVEFGLEGTPVGGEELVARPKATTGCFAVGHDVLNLEPQGRFPDVNPDAMFAIHIVGEELTDSIDGNREGNPPSLVENRGVETDEFAVEVDEGASGVAGIDGRIGLDEV